MDHIMKIGFNTFDNHVLAASPYFELPLQNGADFVFCHTDPGLTGAFEGAKKADKLSEVFYARGLDFIANFEFQNVAGSKVDDAGHEWCRTPDGAHRLNPNPDFIKALASRGNLIGVTYDEFDYAVSTRNLSLWLGSKRLVGDPVVPFAGGGSVLRQGLAAEATLRDYVNTVKAMGAPAFSGEHVFPILYHTFARCGMVPCYKAMKESASNLQFAVAAGAALQYKTPLWSCVDLWYRQSFPGHSPQELRANLEFAWLAGADLAYVESDPVLVTRDALSIHGEAYTGFVKEYLGRGRQWHAADYRPEIGIIRYDDTYWGQNAFWDRGLFGNPKLRPGERNREWIRVMDLVTFGRSGKQSFNLNRIDKTLLNRHVSFLPVNALAVFDAYASAEALASLKLVFLTGIFVSPETMRAVQVLVRENGLTAVCPPRFLPSAVRMPSGASFARVRDGKGEWIISEDPAADKVKTAVRDLLGSPDEIRLPFADREFRLRVDRDGNGFTVL